MAPVMGNSHGKVSPPSLPPMPPSSNAMGMGMPPSRLEAELARSHEPDNFLTNVAPRVLPPSSSMTGGPLALHHPPSAASSMAVPQLDSDPLATDLSFLLDEESNSPPPPAPPAPLAPPLQSPVVTASPTRQQAPPAPPGATLCEFFFFFCLFI